MSIATIRKTMEDIARNSISLQPDETIQCEKCKIRYGHDHVFTPQMFVSPCPWCGGKWVRIKQSILESRTNMLPSFALIAYLRTGKDTFIQELQANKLNLSGSPEDRKWAVYALPETDFLPFFHLMMTKFQKRRFAFADALKIYTHNKLGLKDCPAHAFENVKDTALFPMGSELKTMRDYYKQYAQEARSKNPLTWVEIVLQQIEQEHKSENFIDVISDWRFPNELIPRTNPVSTIRLFRKDVPIPLKASSGQEETEHALDHFQTDYLLVPPGQEEFQMALQNFPQYKDFVRQYYITCVF